jgi:hypothetical protein
VTATTAELNYVDGVTSAIQTQIDAKAPIANPTFTGSFTSPGIDDNADAIAITIDSSENVGIGTSSAGTFRTKIKHSAASVTTGLGIEASANDSVLRVFHSGSVAGFNATYSSTGAYVPMVFNVGSGGEVMRLGTDGSVGIGTSSPGGLPLHLKVASGDNKLRMQTANKDAFVMELENSTGNLKLGTNTTAGALVIADGGYVGIPQSSSSSISNPLHITKEIGGYQAYFNNDNGSGQGLKVRIKANDSGNFNILDLVSASTGSDVSAMVVRDDGIVGIGNSSPSNGSLCVAGVLALDPGGPVAIDASNGRPNLARSADGELRIAAGKDSASQITFHTCTNNTTNAAERLRIGASGNITPGADNAQDLGATGTRYKDLHMSGIGFFGLYGTGVNDGNVAVGEGVYVGAISSANQLRSSSEGGSSTTLYIGNAAIQVSSDQRLKTNIVDTEMDALEKVNQVRVVDFNWDDPSDTSFNNRNARGKWTGVLAQELVDIFPFAVNAPRNESDLSIDTDSEQRWLVDQAQMVPVLIKAIQEQQTLIESLTARVTGS